MQLDTSALQALTVKELNATAKKLRIKEFSNLKKQDLIKLILEVQSKAEQPNAEQSKEVKSKNKGNNVATGVLEILPDDEVASAIFVTICFLYILFISPFFTEAISTRVEFDPKSSAT